jgi:hypothetical protein
MVVLAGLAGLTGLAAFGAALGAVLAVFLTVDFWVAIRLCLF